MAFDQDGLPHPSTLHELSDKEKHAVLTRLFEHSEELQLFAADLVASPHGTYDSLIDSIQEGLLTLLRSAQGKNVSENISNLQKVDSILNSHPRLGESRKDLSAASAAEQANLQGSQNSTEAQELTSLNEEYEIKYNGLRYLVFVNGRSRPEIFVDMRRRIARNDITQERAEGISALCSIAKDRVKKVGVARPAVAL